MNQRERADRFHELHQAGTLILPNAWDAASAALMAEAGPLAIATTSSGVSWSTGVPDGECLDRKDALEAIRRMVCAINLPLSADIETGYGTGPSEVADTIRATIDAGAVGANIEDRLRTEAGPLRPTGEQCERLAAAREAADARGLPFILNARTDVFLAGAGEPDERDEMVLERGERYRDAGADCLFVPGLIEIEAIRRLVRRSPLPINILLAPGRGPGIRELSDVGVRRITVGHSIAAAAYGCVRRATVDLLAGKDTELREGISVGEMQGLMAGPVTA